MFRTPLSIALAAALGLAGCQATLNPAPSARQISDSGAIAAAQGIRMIARADAWSGIPADLGNQITPLYVKIENNTAQPLYIRYNQFRLVSAEGRRFSALPPFQIDGTATVSVANPYFPSAGFDYAPYLSPYYPGATVYAGSWGLNAPYWQRFGTIMPTVQLPTADMVQKALPEGVLQPGGQVSGFLYFEGVGPNTEWVQLRANYENARTGGFITRLTIPFSVG
jgi:hypothetical protein